MPGHHHNINEEKSMEINRLSLIESAAGKPAINRRHFLKSAAGLAMFPMIATGETDPTRLWEPMTETEEEQVASSAMAEDILNFAGKGYSCAESTLIVCLRFLGKPESMVHAAAYFGGGMGHRDHCGLLTGGLMGIGIAAGVLYEERTAMKTWSQEIAGEYWEWFASRAPIQCRELKTNYSDTEMYLRMAKRCACRMEMMFREAGLEKS